MNINQNYIPINQFSRPGKKRTYTRNIVWHYTGNPGATAEGHFYYFGWNLARQNPDDSKPDTYASAHTFIDPTQILEIIPLDEVAYHATQANPYSVGVELCIQTDGTFHPDTIAQAIEYGAYLCQTYNLNPLTDFFRHFDITGKICPKPWVDDPAAWEDFKQSVDRRLRGEDKPVLDKGVAKTVVNTWMKPSYDEAVDVDQKEYIRWLANQLRLACGMKEDEDFE